MLVAVIKILAILTTAILVIVCASEERTLHGKGKKGQLTLRVLKFLTFAWLTFYLLTIALALNS